jgi:hypothetical protein
VSIAGEPTVGLDDADTTGRPAPTIVPSKPHNLTEAQMEYGLNTFRSLTLNSKSITLGSRPRGQSIPKMAIIKDGSENQPVNVVGTDGV